MLSDEGEEAERLDTANRKYIGGFAKVTASQYLNIDEKDGYLLAS